VHAQQRQDACEPQGIRMTALSIEATPIAGVLRVTRLLRTDDRGAFARLYDHALLAEVGWPDGVAQVNFSLTRAAGTVRGLHFQHPPHAEAKLVSCIHGRVFDVAVDLRQGSPTFGSWHAEELCASEGTALLIPPGCAHGFQALTDDTTLIYCHSAPYVAEAEDGFSVHDAGLAIDWPLPVVGLSPRDAALPGIPSDYAGIAT
jgi:dTDP-4-dehydrorhamnose 3,5-epimerase